MGRVAVFIDGGYLDFTLRDEFARTRIDFQLLSELLTSGMDLLRTYYYNCLPYQSATPTPDESQRFSRAQKFHDALSRLPRYQVRQGKLAYRGTNHEGKPIFEQKCVDILLGTDLVLLAAKRQISDAILLAGDSDFLPAVNIAKDEGVSIHLIHGSVHRPHNELWSAADVRVPVTQNMIDKIKQ